MFVYKSTKDISTLNYKDRLSGSIHSHKNSQHKPKVGQ